MTFSVTSLKVTLMTKLIICKGLPASGKSTWAKEVIKDSSTIRVNRDEIRTMIHNDIWNGKREKTTVVIRDAMIVAGLKAGKNVISDDTNLSESVVRDLTRLAVENGAQVEFKDFTEVSPQECIKRDLKRSRSVGASVIWRMYRDHLKPKPIVQDESLPPAIIVDMDGTLALINPNRSPYEDHLCEQDSRHEAVALMVEGFLQSHPEVSFIVMSGRDEGRSREATLKWIETHLSVTPHALFMREAGDVRHDNLVKGDLFNAHIRDQYNVVFVVDDRDQVVQLWRDEIGLPTFQVNYGDF